jgi:hypothetical protein
MSVCGLYIAHPALTCAPEVAADRPIPQFHPFPAGRQSAWAGGRTALTGSLYM